MRRPSALLVVCRDGPRMAALARGLSFFAPEIERLEFPAWDCLPYDRVSPHAGVLAQRMTTLSRLANVEARDKPVGGTDHGQRHFAARAAARLSWPGNRCRPRPAMCCAMERVASWLELNGYARASTVREPGDYAVRGGILDLFAPGMAEPVRLDFFGDQIETIRAFDPETQRTQYDLRALDLVPVSEFQLTTDTIRRFRLGYVEAFGAATRDDQLYEAVSEGRRYPGMEHWLPLFHRTHGHAVRLSRQHAGRARAAGR